MPEHRGISITLQSQYDARSIREYPLPSTSATSPSNKGGSKGSISTYGASNSRPSSSSTSSSSITEVYVPIYPRSQIWINYTCRDPVEIIEPLSPDVKYYYFKLSFNNECFLSWGIGSEDNWQGKVSFAISPSATDLVGAKVLRKSAFLFPTEEEVARKAAGFEIQVFRSKARRREEVNFEQTEVLPKDQAGCGFHLRPAGVVKKKEPKRKYAYALIDPVGQPFATFKYHCRTAAQLESLGFDLSVNGNEHPWPCILPEEAPNGTEQSPSVGPLTTQEHLPALHCLSIPSELFLAAKDSLPVPESPSEKNVTQSQEEALRRIDGLSMPEPKCSESGVHQLPDQVPDKETRSGAKLRLESRNVSSLTGSLLSRLRRRGGSRGKN